MEMFLSLQMAGQTVPLLLFTGVIKSYRIGKIIGQDTGEKIHYYGDYLTFKLPHMNLEFVVSPKEFIQHGGENLDEGVSPDIRLCEDYKTPESLIRQLRFNNY